MACYAEGVVAFEQLASQAGEDVDLELGALLVARDEFPALDVDRELARLDALAARAKLPAGAHANVEEAVEALAQHLYAAEGFRGNEADYGDPRNSWLNLVLERRLGIPITLAIVLLGVARRLGLRAHGISFPGHFLVRFERSGGTPLVVDPFHGARRLGLGELQTMLRRALGDGAHLRPEHLRAATARATLVRVLQNLKAAHVARGDYARALVAQTRIVELVPGEAAPIRDRGALQAHLGAVGGAIADLERYLELAPAAADAASVRATLQKLALEPRRVAN
jgi:regulator of sirC expression with transglutaminase-like and TPR domain